MLQEIQLKKEKKRNYTIVNIQHTYNYEVTDFYSTFATEARFTILTVVAIVFSRLKLKISYSLIC